MGGRSKKQTVGYRYFLGVHGGLVRGCIDFISRVRFDKRTAWEGLAKPGDQIQINRPSLFGGEKREGGVSGTIDVLGGTPDQQPNSYLIARLGPLMPAFRGFTSLVFRQFYWGNNPYLGSRNPTFTVQRIHQRGDTGEEQWYDSTSEITRDFGQLLKVGESSAQQEGNGNPVIAQLSENLVAVGIASGATNNWLRAFSFNHATGSWSQAGESLGLGIESFLGLCHLRENIVAFWGTQARFRVYEWDGGQFNLLASHAPPDVTTGGHSVVMCRLNNSDWAFYHNSQGERQLRVYRFDGTSIFALGAPHVVDNRERAGRELIPFDDHEVFLTLEAGTPPHRVFRWNASTETWLQVRALSGSGLGNSAWKLPGPFLAWRSGRTMNLIRVPEESGETQALEIVASYPEELTAGDSVTRITQLAQGTLATFGNLTNIVEAVRYGTPTGDMNPAHIVRELFTEAYGLHYPEIELDEGSFISVANQLFEESMGMSWVWDRQGPVGDAMDEVLRHVDGLRYVDPETGLFTVKLVRGDYDSESLLVLNPSNIERVENFARPSIDELKNALTVKYWDRSKNEPAAVSVTDPALVMQQGRVSHETIEYLGFAERDVASRVAQRDLRALSVPLASCTVYANRAARPLRPGDVFRLDWPDYKIDAVMRVTEVAYGDGKTHRIRIKCVEDVFATPETVVTSPETDVYEDPALAAPQAALKRVVQEAPYLELVRELGQRQVDEELEYDPESGWLSIAAARPVEEINATIAVDAGAGFEEVGEPVDFCPAAILDANVGKLVGVIPIRDGQELDQVEIGQLAQIGDELVRVDSISEAAIEVGRGVLDTIPTPHQEGELVLFWGGFAGSDETAYTAQEVIDVKLLTATGRQTLEPGDAPTDQVTFNQRALRPYPPGDVRVNDEPLPSLIVGDGPFEFTWKHRDRLQQTAGAIIDHTDGNIGPEDGQSYTLEVRDDEGSLVRSFTGITGTSQTYDAEQVEADVAAGGLPLHVSLFSVRDALASLKAYTFLLDVPLLNGWGVNWGNAWGGTPQPWTPALMDVAAWFDAADESTVILDGSEVEEWLDKSGNNRHVSQATSALRPSYTVGESVNFNLSILVRNEAFIYNLGETVLYVVAKWAATEGNVLVGEGSSSSNNPVYDFRRNIGNMAMFIRSDGNSIRLNNNSLGSVGADNTDRLISWSDSGSQVTGHSNGEAGGTPRNYSRVGTTLNRFAIGGLMRATPAERVIAEIREVIVADRLHVAITRERIEGYLAWKWGLQDDLPIAHPYKGEPPMAIPVHTPDRYLQFEDDALATHGDNATLVGSPTFVDGLVGRALSGFSNSDYVNASVAGHGGESFVLVLMVRSTSGSTAGIMSSMPDILSPSGGIDLTVSATASTGIIWRISDGSVIRRCDSGSIPEIRDASRWGVVALRWDADTNTMDFFANGVLKNSETFDATGPITESTDFYLGRRHDGDFPMVGQLDEFLVFREALSTALIEDISHRLLTGQHYA